MQTSRFAPPTTFSLPPAYEWLPQWLLSMVGFGLSLVLILLNVPSKGPVGQFYTLTGIAVTGLVIPLLFGIRWRTPMHLAASLLALVGWDGLLALIYYAPTHIGALWLFFWLLVIAITGTVLPILHWLLEPAGTWSSRPMVVVRRSLWIAAFCASYVWLSIRGGGHPLLVLGLALAFAITEWLWELRERVQWAPTTGDDGE